VNSTTTSEPEIEFKVGSELVTRPKDDLEEEVNAGSAQAKVKLVVQEKK
jgi:hypothetical protein